VNVYELKTGRPKIVNPCFKDFTAECFFPRWFENEVTALLESPEPYSIAAGAGLICRMTPFLAQNYNAVNARGNAHALPLWHVFNWVETVAPSLKTNIVESFTHEVDDVTDSFSTLKKLYDRNARSHGAVATMIKERRDDLESVGFVCMAMKHTGHASDLFRLDALALTCESFLKEAIVSDNQRLAVIRKYFPERWWGK
jgi:hypothetical protein